MFFSSFLHPLQLRRARHRRHAVRRPRVEPLEDRCLLSFSPAVSFPAGPTPPYTVVTGDFNTDGHLDVATAADTVNMLAGNGDGTLQPPIQIAKLPVTSPSPGADFTSDGIPDRIYRDIEYNLVVRPGRGDGTFGDPIYTPTTGADMLALTTADLNGDGRLDLVLAYWTEFMGGAGSSLLGRGDGTFGGQETFPLGVRGPEGGFDGDHDRGLRQRRPPGHRGRGRRRPGRGSGHDPAQRWQLASDESNATR